MSDQSHRGGKSPGPFTPSVDRRTLELDDALRGVEVFSGAVPGLGLARDPTRAGAARLQALGKPGHFFRGKVIHALPGVNWYKVQGGDGNGWVSACMLSDSSLMPLGARSIAMACPNDDVLVFKPAGLNHGFIVGVMPPVALDGAVLLPDFVVQGGGSGLRREGGHKYPIKNLYQGGGVLDWSAQRPADQTPLDRGWVTAFGMALTVDDFLIQARVNESAGLWMTLVDGWVRLAGEQLLIESPVHEVDAGNDEGEARYFKGVAAYPHEAVGQYAPFQALTAQFPDQEVQYTSHKAKTDLPTGDESLQPLYRYQEYAGYLGQGSLRFVVCPPRAYGRRLAADSAEADHGLFMESIGLDGAYSLVAAKSVHIGKRCRIPVPRQKVAPQAATGDDAAASDDPEAGPGTRADSYKFSSLYGAGPGHKVGDVSVPDGVKAMTRATAALDLIAYDLNWKALHPFHYHVGDYSLPQAAVKGGVVTQEAVDYARVNAAFYLADPQPKQLVIDHRYGAVNYYERHSFLRMHDDGTVHICGGGGEEIILGGGHIFLNAPGGIHLRPGGDLTAHAAQIVLKAKGSIDASSSDGDVRLKAEGNMQLLAGNSGRGGMLIESRGAGTAQQYKNLFGEDVRGSGVVIRASNGVAAVLAQDIYLRTGGDDVGEGDILLDASRGKRRVQVFGREFHTYTARGVTFNYGPLESTSTVRKSYFFGEKTMIADVKLLLGGKLIGYTGGGGSAGVVVDGGVFGTKSFATAGVMADKKGMFLGKIPGGFAGTISSACNAAAAAVDEIVQIGTLRHQTTVVNKYYQEGQIGDDALISLVKFGFRDPPGVATQYKTEGFLWPEATWQQLARLGGGTGGEPWQESPVVYQGQETYPWPGKKKWVDEPTFLRPAEMTLFDPAAGVDKDRPGPYEDPALAATTLVTADNAYTLIR